MQFDHIFLFIKRHCITFEFKYNILFMRLILVFIVLVTSVNHLNATNYYFSTSGNNNNKGTSPKEAFKSLSQLGAVVLKPGDKILLKKGDVFEGTIELINVLGTSKQNIYIGSYGKGSRKPLINAKGLLHGILIQDSSFITVSNIAITANGGGAPSYFKGPRFDRYGVLILGKNQGSYSNITLDNLHIKDVFKEEKGFDRGSDEVLTAMGNQEYGYGIRTLNRKASIVYSHIKITNCLIENVGHTGIKFSGNANQKLAKRNIRNVEVLNNQVLKAGGPAIQVGSIQDGVFRGNKTNYSGSYDDSRKWGRGSGLWTWGCLDVLIEKNEFRNAHGPADSAGTHIDFNNKNIIIQYNLSENNDGGFVEILGNNHNCTYRYNVSINDGSRKFVKGKTLGAGTMIGVNGWVGKKNPRLGPFNVYIYNNTIYVKKGINPEVGASKHTRGILIVNNIFYLEDAPVADHRRPFRPENGPLPNVVFENNLFLDKNNWPSKEKMLMVDEAPMFGDPKFKNQGGLQLEDYTPTNKNLIKNKGIFITNIPCDSIGLVGGFKLTKDILGNKIIGTPDMGAIEVK